MSKGKILICVEGEKEDKKLMEMLFNLYGISTQHEIVPYKTNIYQLYHDMFDEDDSEDMDLLQVLKAREQDVERKKIFDERYSDVLLVFDMDPQDRYYSAGRLKEMVNYFKESTDTGKLYLNFPMVESFFHMSTIPDLNYNAKVASLEELKGHAYKSRVTQECVRRGNRYDIAKLECSQIIKQNMEKAWHLVGEEGEHEAFPELGVVLERQLDLLEQHAVVSVLCTCVSFIVEFDSKLIKIN